MTSKTLPVATLISALLLAPALAWSAPATASPDARLFGNPATSETVSRTVTITPDMHHVRVASGESVALRAGDRTVAWTFLQAMQGSTMNLGLLMPDVPQAADVYVHIEPSLVYSAG